MKIKTFSRTHNNTPNKCEHEWREFGTRLCEEVYIPVRETMEAGHYGGWIVCDKCGWSPFVYKYKVIGKRDHIEPLLGPWPDTMVEILDWGTEKEPTSPVIDEFAYAEFSWWDRIKQRVRKWI